MYVMLEMLNIPCLIACLLSQRIFTVTAVLCYRNGFLVLIHLY